MINSSRVESSPYANPRESHYAEILISSIAMTPRIYFHRVEREVPRSWAIDPLSQRAILSIGGRFFVRWFRGPRDGASRLQRTWDENVVHLHERASSSPSLFVVSRATETARTGNVSMSPSCFIFNYALANFVLPSRPPGRFMAEIEL